MQDCSPYRIVFADVLLRKKAAGTVSIKAFQVAVHPPRPRPMMVDGSMVARRWGGWAGGINYLPAA